MAEGLNRVMILGNLGADPELRVTQSGQSVLGMRIATSETWLDKNNARQEKTEWHSVSLWGKRGEALAKILRKGERIFVEGSLRTSTYEKDGEKRYRTDIVAQKVFLAGKPKGQDSQRPETNGNGKGAGYQAPAPPHAPKPMTDDFDFGFSGEPPPDDIPF